MNIMHSPFAMIALGGSLGALLRFYLSEFFTHQFLTISSAALSFSLFPLGVLLVNMLGSLALGIFLTYMQYAEKQNLALRNFFAIGFLGSFTTFSTFIIDSIKFILPFLMESTFLQQNFTQLEKVYDTFTTIFPYHTNEFLFHSFLFSLYNIILNILLCIMCVWIGHKFMKKSYDA